MGDGGAAVAAQAEGAAGASGAPTRGGRKGRTKEKGREPNPIVQLIGFAGKRKWLLYLGIALSAASQLVGFIPYICIWLVARDLIAVAPDWTQAANIAGYGWAAVIAAVASIALYFIALMCTHLAAFRTASNIRKLCAEKLMRLPLGYFDTHATGKLRREIDGSAGLTETLIAHILPDAGGSIAMVAGMLAMLFFFDWRMGLSCMAAVFASIVAMAAMMGPKNMEFMKRYQEALVRMNKTGTEYVRGIPVVKVFQQTVYSFRAFHDSIADYADLAQAYAVKGCRVPQSLNLSFLNGIVVFLVPAAILIAPGEADFAAFVTDFAFYAIFSAVIPTAMAKVMFMSEAGQSSADAMSRILQILQAEPLSVPVRPRRPRGNGIVFEHVRFSYEGARHAALDDVSFTVAAGATVALVGPSGGGKTTAASLVPRFWDVDAGAVRVGGVDVRDMDPHELMDQVAFVFQTNRLFRGTLAENVRAARPDATDEEVAAALSAAQCDDIVAKLPKGADTLLGTGGTYLSGGEVQRVALARAILKDSPIVVLDEATAFADPENEALIQRALSRLMEGRTVLMIAHRLTTVAHADGIVVLEGGRVAERGTHEQLVDAGGLYARMWADYRKSAAWRISADAGDAGRSAEARGGEE